MEPTRANRRRVVQLVVGIATATALVAASPAAHAQSRYRVLVPALQAQGGAKENFGRDVAEKLRESIEDMLTHAPVERRELRSALRQYKIKEDDLVDCITSRQLAVRMGVEVVVCGTYQPAGEGMQVAAKFVTARTGEEFDIEPFVARSADSAALMLFSGFEKLVNQQRLSRFCIDYLASEQWANALENCNQALAINPNSPTTLYGRARALVGLDSLEQAMPVLERLLEINPGHGDALQTAGYVATKLNRPQQALEYYRTYLELNPGNVQVRLTIAREMYNAGDPKGALQLAEEGLSVDSTDTSLRMYAGHFALGAAQKIEQDSGSGSAGARSPEALQLYEKALGYYRQVFEAEGSEADTLMLRNLISTLVVLDRHEEAVEMGSQILQARPDNASLWSTYADALEKSGRLTEALAALDSVLARDPDYEMVYSRQVMWFTRAGEIERVEEAFRQAVARGEGRELEPDALARNVLSYGYNEKFQKGDRRGALPYLELVRELNTTPVTRGLASYLAGFALRDIGIEVQEPQTAESARAALPLFQKALQYFEDARPYAESNNVDLAEPISNVRDYIEIQEALIKRGR
ncbi:MAG TPA: tetratricopeptide repeat protein [Longimicrobiales bacterium]